MIKKKKKREVNIFEDIPDQHQPFEPASYSKPGVIQVLVIEYEYSVQQVIDILAYLGVKTYRTHIYDYLNGSKYRKVRTWERRSESEKNLKRIQAAHVLQAVDEILGYRIKPRGLRGKLKRKREAEGNE